jgi:hypothetical protein
MAATIASSTAVSWGGCNLKRDKESSAAERDVTVLEKIIQLPIRPEEVWFRSLPRGASGGVGPTDWTFLAVMRFDPQTLEEFVKSGKLVEKLEPRLPRKEIAAWFPPEVIAALEPAGDTHMRVKGRRFDGSPFARGTATTGSFFVLDHSPFVILRRPQD